MATPLSFSKMLVALPGLSSYERHRAPRRRNLRSAKLRTGQQSAPSRRRQNKTLPALLDPCAAALNQNDQHNNRQHTGYNLNNCGRAHIDFLLSSMIVEVRK
jgi:hypothetical protein